MTDSSEIREMGKDLGRFDVRLKEVERMTDDLRDANLLAKASRESIRLTLLYRLGAIGGLMASVLGTVMYFVIDWRVDEVIEEIGLAPVTQNQYQELVNEQALMSRELARLRLTMSNAKDSKHHYDFIRKAQ